jgi:branched-chain amino acid aminotransferase
MFVYLNGKFVKENDARVSVFDHGFMFGDGVYETLRTYGGRVCQLDDHLKRLKKSAKFLKLKYGLSRVTVNGAITKLIKMNGYKEARVRIMITRGCNGMDFSTCKKPTVVIAAWELKEDPPVIYRKGVDIITVNVTRIFPEAKTLSLLPRIVGEQEAKRRRVFEAIFVDENKFVREGTVTNVFIVKDGEVLTPKTGILKGTVRGAAIEAARRRGISVIMRDFTLNHLLLADEAFITNAPRGIVPVKKVNGKKIGDGVPGPMTKKIMEAFAEYVESNIGGKSKSE